MTTPDAPTIPTTPPLAAAPMVNLLRWLIALAVVVGSVVVTSWLLHLEPGAMPVRVVAVDGAVHRLSAPVLARTITEHLQSGILTQDLSVLRQAVEALPWVHTASLRRVWPDRIQLTVTEHQPLARWGEDGLATAEGVVFRPKDEPLPNDLPRLTGQDAAAPRVVARYLDWQERLAPLGLKISAMTLDPRGAWSLDLANGLRLELGTEKVEQRLARFMNTWPQLAAAGRAARVDLRYANGLAVRWAEGGSPSELALAESEGETRIREPKNGHNKATPTGEGRNKSRNKG